VGEGVGCVVSVAEAVGSFVGDKLPVEGCSVVGTFVGVVGTVGLAVGFIEYLLRTQSNTDSGSEAMLGCAPESFNGIAHPAS